MLLPRNSSRHSLTSLCDPSARVARPTRYDLPSWLSTRRSLEDRWKDMVNVSRRGIMYVGRVSVRGRSGVRRGGGGAAASVYILWRACSAEGGAIAYGVAAIPCMMHLNRRYTYGLDQSKALCPPPGSSYVIPSAVLYIYIYRMTTRGHGLF